MSIAEQTTKVYRLLRGMHGTYLIEIGVKLGFFRAIFKAGSKGITSKDLSKKCGTDERYTQQWCQMAMSLELVDCAEGSGTLTRDPSTRYLLAPFFEEILGNDEDVFYIGGSAGSHIQIAKDYARFPQLFRTGKTFPFQDHNKSFLKSVASSNKALAKRFIALVLPKLPELKEKLERDGGKILDIGCGGGHAIVELAKAFPKCSCTGLDIEPQSIKHAKQLIIKNGLESRVNANKVTGVKYGSGDTFDLVTMFLSLHEITPKLKQKVLDSASRVLKRGGTLLVYDEAYPEKLSDLREEPLLFAVMAQWFEGPWGNIINTKEEIREMVSKAGLSVKAETQFSRFFILTAVKP